MKGTVISFPPGQLPEWVVMVTFLWVFPMAGHGLAVEKRRVSKPGYVRLINNGFDFSISMPRGRVLEKAKTPESIAVTALAPNDKGSVSVITVDLSVPFPLHGFIAVMKDERWNWQAEKRPRIHWEEKQRFGPR